MNHYRSHVLAILIGLLLVACVSPAQARGPSDAVGHAALDPDAVLVRRAVLYIDSQLPPADRAIDRAAAVEVRTLIVLRITGASNAEILAYNETAPNRLNAAAALFVDRAHFAVDAAFHSLHRRHGSGPVPYGETLGVAILTFDSNVATHLRIRWGRINDLVAWLTR